MNRINEVDVAFFNAVITKVQKIVTVSHTRPDGDAIGSSLALNTWLTSLGREVISIFPDPIPDSLAFIQDKETVVIFKEDPQKTKQVIAEASLIICLDLNSFARTEGLADILLNAECQKVLIDHHLAPDVDKFDLVVSQPEISSTCELLFYFLMAQPQVGNSVDNLPHQTVRALMVGMTTDTNNFANSTYPSTFKMASELLAAKVDRDELILSLYQSYKENRLRLLGYILKDLMTIHKGVAYIILNSDTLKKYNVREGDTEGFVNFPLSIKDVDMSIFLKEDDGYFRVSVRSKKGKSANQMAKLFFNGGGHENAAGGRLYFPKDIASQSEAASYIETSINNFLKNG